VFATLFCSSEVCGINAKPDLRFVVEPTCDTAHSIGLAASHKRSRYLARASCVTRVFSFFSTRSNGPTVPPKDSRRTSATSRTWYRSWWIWRRRNVQIYCGYCKVRCKQICQTLAVGKKTNLKLRKAVDSLPGAAPNERSQLMHPKSLKPMVRNIFDLATPFENMQPYLKLKRCYNRGGQTAAREPHAALWAFLRIIYLFCIYIAKCRNIVKWYCGS